VIQKTLNKDLFTDLDHLMGAVASLFSDKDEIHDVVLVPPLFERDHKGRSRLAKSSYDFLFIKPNLRWLFNDYLPVGAAKSILYFSPPEDPRISVTARFRASLDSGKKYVRLGDSKYGKEPEQCVTYRSINVREHQRWRQCTISWAARPLQLTGAL